MRLPVLHKSGASSVKLAREDPHHVEARRRAGTLMGGETAGGRGEVQVWSAQPVRARRLVAPALAVLLWSIVAWALLALVDTYPLVWTGQVMGVLAGLGIMAAVKQGIQRYIARLCPSYLCTDDAGIAFVTDGISVALAWEEIVGLRRTGPDALTFYTRSSGVRGVSLAGFSRSDVKSVVSLISRNGDLSSVIPFVPDAQSSVLWPELSAARKPNSWRFAADMMLFQVAVWHFGPIHVRPGESMESLAAAGSEKSLPKPGTDSPTEPTAVSGPDASGFHASGLR